MAQKPSPQSHRIAVATRLNDSALRRRLALEVAGTKDLAWGEDVADVLITDEVELASDGTCPVVFLGEADPAELPPAVRALLPLGSSSQTIVSAVRLVLEGLFVFPEGARERQREIGAEHGEEDDSMWPPTAKLTPRETEVLQLLAAGASNKLIARQLDVSVHTAKFHVASLLRKLGASGRLEAVGIGLRTGLLML